MKLNILFKINYKVDEQMHFHMYLMQKILQVITLSYEIIGQMR